MAEKFDSNAAMVAVVAARNARADIAAKRRPPTPFPVPPRDRPAGRLLGPPRSEDARTATHLRHDTPKRHSRRVVLPP